MFVALLLFEKFRKGSEKTKFLISMTSSDFDFEYVGVKTPLSLVQNELSVCSGKTSGHLVSICSTAVTKSQGR